MAILQVNHTNILSIEPNYMGTGGTYIAKPPAVVRQNGLGLDIVAGYSTLEWSWPYLSITEMNFWYTMLLGQASAQFNHAYLYNHMGNLITYSNAVVKMVAYGHAMGDTFFDCKLEITNLI